MSQMLSFDARGPWRFIGRVGERARREGRVQYCVTRSTSSPFLTLCDSQRFATVTSLCLSVRADALCSVCARQASQREAFLLLKPQHQPSQQGATP